MDTKSRQIILRVTLRFQSNERFVASVVVVVGIITDAQAKLARPVRSLSGGNLSNLSLQRGEAGPHDMYL